MENNGEFMATGILEPWNRIDAEIEVFHPSTSQFYKKVKAHENQHKKDYNDGFDGHVFIQMDEFSSRIIGITKSTFEELELAIKEEIVQYLAEELQEMDSVQNCLEERAYAISDAMLPSYVYQGVCEGY